MTDKKVYAWAYKDFSGNFQVNTLIPIDNLDNFEPLYSIEEVQYVIEHNELPKRPVAWVRWNDGDEHKRAYPDAITGGMRWENTVIVCTADELLNELQKEI
ncbi:hypothetical protein [Leuconostoc gasicomitatum]|uniref:hypothetical protein n=1 Tax=Leuconostoc gasicomitatum TaxID=115778 RepID=UPI0007E197C9|nr:hypothetical protein [Leuconostoc gasicomitatum]CUW06706.1 hypothetical protein PB1E_0739 [Leuconostoc gasicomitatum]